MPRKQKPESTSTEIENTSSTATIEPPVSELPTATPAEVPSSALPQTFADRVGERNQRPPSPDPFQLAHDALAGVRLYENRRDRVMAVQFDEKPGPEVIATVKDAGYRWNHDDQVWTHPVRVDAAMSTRIEAERLYQEVRRMIQQDKGLTSEQDIPF